MVRILPHGLLERPQPAFSVSWRRRVLAPGVSDRRAHLLVQSSIAQISGFRQLSLICDVVGPDDSILVGFRMHLQMAIVGASAVYHTNAVSRVLGE